LQKIVLSGDEALALQDTQKNQQRQSDGSRNPLNPIDFQK
jgi:hypothetical protein